ncbi:MAG: glycosyltransferase, partial [Deltaproteobacteria bacterium]
MALRVCQLCAVDFTLNHFLLPLVDGMKTEGWDVTCVCSDGNFVPELRNKGYKIITVPIQRSLNVFSHIVSLFLLYKVFKRNKFDVLHAHTPIAALIGRIAAKAARVPLVIYTAHGFYF